LKTSKYFKT